MTPRLKAMATMGVCTAVLGAGTMLAAAPASAAGVYLCFKPTNTTVFYPNGQQLVTASGWTPDGVSTTPDGCPTGDLPIGG